MSYNSNSEWKNWIEEAISNNHINYYEYNDFDNLKPIGSGGFGKVYCANWKNLNNKIVALKSLNDATAEKFAYEFKIHRNVDIHDNIIRLYGITTDNKNYSSKNYMLVMEYADGGTLREYLSKNSGKLTWNDKIRMAHQLANAVSCLHNLGVIHRDLYSNNVLVHRDSIKLTDFGLSKKIGDQNTLQQGGVVPYIDPKKFESISHSPYSLSKKSDIYSIGVLLWEISSCRPPFVHNTNQYKLPELIFKGLRETPIPNTPEDYIKIYTDCWEFDPDVRPTIHNVVTRLEAIRISNGNVTTNDYRTPLSHDYLSQSSNQIGYKSMKDIVDGIAALSYKISIYNKNKRQKILNYLDDNHVTSKEIFDWLSKNQSDINSALVLGDFNYLGIATEIDKQKAYGFYLSAGDGDDGHSVAQYNLGFMCENDQSGDTFQAMNWYNKSAEQGNYEARGSLNRLRGSAHKTISASNKYSMEALDKVDGFNYRP